VPKQPHAGVVGADTARVAAKCLAGDLVAASLEIVDDALQTAAAPVVEQPELRLESGDELARRPPNRAGMKLREPLQGWCDLRQRCRLVARRVLAP
jgi:hypothetical protein